jgi:hypothetical protein
MMAHLAFDAPLAAYAAQAEALLAGWQAGDERAVGVFRNSHPAFLDAAIPWLRREMTPAELRATPGAGALVRFPGLAAARGICGVGAAARADRSIRARR